MKPKPDLLDAARHLLGPQFQLDAERLQHVGAAAAAGGGAVAMLGDRLAERRDEQTSRRRDVEGAGGVATRATGIDRMDIRGKRHMHRLLAHHPRQACHLVHRLALQAQSHQERAELRRSGHARHDLFHRRRGLALVERMARHQLRDCLPDHASSSFVTPIAASSPSAGWLASRIAEI